MQCQTISGYTINPYTPVSRQTWGKKSKSNKRGWEKYVVKGSSNFHIYEYTRPAVIETEEIFKKLAAQWRRETRTLSMMIHKTLLNSVYRKIIDMGESVAPYILKELENKPDHWFIALEEIYRDKNINPVPTKDRGNIKKMAKAWVKWGVLNKII